MSIVDNKREEWITLLQRSGLTFVGSRNDTRHCGDGNELLADELKGSKSPVPLEECRELHHVPRTLCQTSE